MSPWLSISLVATLLISCRNVDPVITTLVDGRTLSALASTDDSMLILAIDPGECFGCRRDVHTLIERSRHEPDAVKIVLTRAPDSHEQRAMLIAHIVIAGIVEDGLSSGSLVTIAGREVRSIQNLSALRARPVDSSTAR